MTRYFEPARLPPHRQPRRQPPATSSVQRRPEASLDLLAARIGLALWFLLIFHAATAAATRGDVLPTDVLPAGICDRTVGPADDLSAELSAAVAAGGTTCLEPAVYESVTLNDVTAGGDGATLAGRGAIVRQLRFNGVEGVTLAGLTFDYHAPPGAALWSSPFHISGGGDIEIRDALFDGDAATGLTEADEGFATGKGLRVDDVSNFTLRDSELRGFKWGATFSRVRGLDVVDNWVHSIRQDGLTFAEVSEVRIEGNRIFNFEIAPDSTDHRDMIQFWTTGTGSPSENVRIRDNWLIATAGNPTQTVFMRNQLVDQGKAGDEMFYRNFEVAGNVIFNAHAHGITMGEADGVKIVDNLVIHNTDAASGRSVHVPKINIAPDSRNVVVTGNTAHAITPRDLPDSWTVEDNLLIPSGEGVDLVREALRHESPEPPAQPPALLPPPETGAVVYSPGMSCRVIVEDM